MSQATRVTQPRTILDHSSSSRMMGGNPYYSHTDYPQPFIPQFETFPIQAGMPLDQQIVQNPQIVQQMTMPMRLHPGMHPDQLQLQHMHQEMRGQMQSGAQHSMSLGEIQGFSHGYQDKNKKILMKPKEKANDKGTKASKPTTTKAKQTKVACVGCKASCKRCDDMRPCGRCQKYGLTALECYDAPRKIKERRVPYMRAQDRKKEKGAPNQASDNEDRYTSQNQYYNAYPSEETPQHMNPQHLNSMQYQLSNSASSNSISSQLIQPQTTPVIHSSLPTLSLPGFQENQGLESGIPAYNQSMFYHPYSYYSYLYNGTGQSGAGEGEHTLGSGEHVAQQGESTGLGIEMNLSVNGGMVGDVQVGHGSNDSVYRDQAYYNPYNQPPQPQQQMRGDSGMYGYSGSTYKDSYYGHRGEGIGGLSGSMGVGSNLVTGEGADSIAPEMKGTRLTKAEGNDYLIGSDE